MKFRYIIFSHYPYYLVKYVGSEIMIRNIYVYDQMISHEEWNMYNRCVRVNVYAMYSDKQIKCGIKCSHLP